MTASICSHCGGYVCLQDEDGQRCINCGRSPQVLVPLQIPKGRPDGNIAQRTTKGMADRDRLKGEKPKRKLMLSQHPGA